MQLLGTDTPRFYIFLNVIYRKENEEVEQAITQALEREEFNKLIKLLPKLSTVKKGEIEEWFEDHEDALELVGDWEDLFEGYFQNEEYDMEKVIEKLDYLINEVNTKYLQKFKS